MSDSTRKALQDAINKLDLDRVEINEDGTVTIKDDDVRSSVEALKGAATSPSINVIC